MNFAEAMEKAQDGYLVRRKEWPFHKYIRHVRIRSGEFQIIDETGLPWKTEGTTKEDWGDLEMKIIIIGKGHLGTILAKRMNRWFAIQHWTSDISKLDARALADYDPDVVVNAAGKTDLGWCEDNKEECWRCNVIEPIMLQRRLRPSAMFIHLSSGCVWQGPFNSQDMPFGPMDAPNPACFYGWTKVAADAQLVMEARQQDKKLLILRPRQVFSGVPSPRNTLHKLRSYERLIDTPNSMTSATLIAELIKNACWKGSASSFERPILCVYNRGVTSPYAVGTMLARAGLRDDPAVMSKESLDEFHKPKRVDVVMRDEYFEELCRLYQIDLTNVEKALETTISEFAP